MRKKAIATAILLGFSLLFAVELPAGQVAGRGRPVAPEVIGTLRGEVTSGGERLGFANVVVIGSKLGTQTDNAGRFVLAGVPTGSRRILFDAIGHRKLDSLVAVRAGENPPMRVELVDLFPPPVCQPCFWVPPFQGVRAIPRGAMAFDFVGEALQARVFGSEAELALSSDPDPCQLRIDYYLRSSLSLARLSVVDSAGRSIRVFDRDGATGGHHLVWDGLDHEGRQTPYGWYHVCLETPADTLQLEFGRVRRPPIR